MSQNISFESNESNSSPNSSLNPVLQAALSSLDVQLEEELARYRRQKTGRPVTSSKGLGRNLTRKPIDLIAVERVGTQPQRPALGMSTAPLASFPLFMVQPDAAPQTTPLEQINVATDSPGMVVAAPNPTADQSGTPPQTEHLTAHSPSKAGDLATVATPESPPEDYLESSEQLLRSLAQEEATPQPQKPFAAKLLTPLGVGSILLLLLSSATAAFVLSNPASFAALGLDRFFGPKTPTPAQSSNSSSTEPTSTVPNAGKDTPVVNGPDLAADEFVDLNLNTLSHLETSPKAPAEAASVQVPSLPTLPNGATIPPVAPTVVPNTALPRRAADLSSVLLSPPPQAGNPYTPIPRVAPLPTPATAAPKSSKTQSASDKSSKTQSASDKSNTAKSSKTQSASSKSNTTKSSKTQSAFDKSKNSAQSKPSDTSTKAKQPPMPSPDQVAASPVGIPGGFYYVLLNNRGESVLEQARTIVADAYLENFPKGERIQMGAFPTESEAKAMVEKLQQQGLAASIYHP